jgi:hypothetical protein
MKKSQNFNRDRITLQDIKKKLRSMPELEVPVTLLDKILKSIPQKKIEKVSVSPFRPRFGIWGLGASAAMITILSMIFFMNMYTPAPSNKIVMDLNDSVNNSPNDLNDPFIGDTNHVSYFIQGINIQKAGAFFPEFK